jgi:hypothetical protein
VANDRIYIHELIDIVGHNRAKYQHHMTANWCPVASEERNQRCYGVWSTIGSTGHWPQVVNMWELQGWDGLVANFAHETVGAAHQDPFLAEWWAVAASFRRGGFDRIVVPEAWSSPIEELCTNGVRGEVYVHDIVSLPAGGARAFLDAVADLGRDAFSPYADLIGAFSVVGVNDSEAIVLWALDSWDAWAALEQAWSAGSGAMARWRDHTLELGADWRRSVLMDSALSPMRIGRQPQASDRLPLSDL